jgi:RNA polymerase sigma-70 factor (ECF subfamily)
VDEQTIDAARDGDRSAQAVLIRALQDVWFRFSLGLLYDRDLAADAAQETALRFIRDLPKFRKDSSLKTWSLGIAMNVTREYRRKRKWTRDDAAMNQPDRSPPPPDAAMSSEQATMIRALLASLPDRQRESVILRFFENLSVDETAAAMNVAPGTIKATIHQALRSLRNRMEGKRMNSEG